MSVSLCLIVRWQDLLLPYLMRSKVKRLQEGSHDQQPLLKFVDDAMVVADRKHILEVYGAAVEANEKLVSLLSTQQPKVNCLCYNTCS